MYSEKNKEKLKEKRKQKYIEDQEKLKKKSRDYKATHKEQVSKYNKMWQEKNKDYSKARKKEYRETHKEEIADYQKDWFENHQGYHKTHYQKRIMEYNEFIKTLECSICGEKDPDCLCFHHKDQSPEKRIQISMLSKKRREEELKKCIVLCHNCHMKHHYDTKTAGWGKNKNSEYMKKVKDPNPDSKVIRNRQYNKMRSEQYKQWLEDYKKTVKCSVCGENHPAVIVFHHRDPTQKKMRISSYHGGFKRETVLKEIAKCDVLCMNCHFKLHAKLRREKK